MPVFWLYSFTKINMFDINNFYLDCYFYVNAKLRKNSGDQIIGYWIPLNLDMIYSSWTWGLFANQYDSNTFNSDFLMANPDHQCFVVYSNIARRTSTAKLSMNLRKCKNVNVTGWYPLCNTSNFLFKLV